MDTTPIPVSAEPLEAAYRTGLFRYHRRDAYLVALAALHAALVVTAVITFGKINWVAQALLGAAIVYLHLTNVNVIGHYFVHTPYFTSDRLNRLFSFVNTLGLGLPQEAYRVMHHRHHAYNNDLPDENGQTRDWYSMYRAGKDGQPEPLPKYAFLSHFRLNAIELVSRLRQEGRAGMAAAEMAFLVAVVVALYFINPKGAVFFYLPMHFLCWTMSYIESYSEHYGSQSGNRLANAVSCYDRLYNILWFNNGYHMEHHFRPRLHWSRMEEVRQKHEPEFLANGYRVIRGFHLLNLFQRVRS